MDEIDDKFIRYKTIKIQIEEQKLCGGLYALFEELFKCSLPNDIQYSYRRG